MSIELEIAEREVAKHSGTITFDITKYITPGVSYDHAMLKQAYLDACNAGMWAKPGDENYREGTQFLIAVYQWHNAGWLSMPMSVVDRHGEKSDFFGAVIDSHPEDHPDYRVIEGYLYLEPQSMPEIMPMANGELPW
jgi:hypothetical protein